MFRLLLSLCLSLYCALLIFGDGPARVLTEPRAEPAPEVTSGIRVLPAPPRIVRATPPETVELAAAETPAAIPLEPVPADATAIPANLSLRWVTAGTANVRALPSKRSPLAGKIGQGESVYVMWAEPNGWMRVRSSTGDVTGFVHKSLLTDEAPDAATLDVAAAD